MKKYIIFNTILALIFGVFACDKVYDDIYDDLDKATATQDSLNLIFSKKILAMESYTLTDADYATISSAALKLAITKVDSTYASDIGKYKSFSATILPKNYIYLLLDQKYFTYTSGTEMKVTYNYNRGQVDYISEFDNANYVEYELVDADYDMLGTASGEPGFSNYFKSSISPDVWLPRFIDSTYKTPINWEYKKLTFRYNSGGVTWNRYYVYYYNNGWKQIINPFILAIEDYDAMGSGYGEPGQYDNFSSSLAPENFLPAYLKIKFMGAAAGDVKQVFYKYNSSGITTRVKEYLYDGTIWTEYQSTVEQESIFKFTPSGWLFVPPLKFVETTKTATVSYTLTNEDYALTGDGKYNNFTLSVGDVLERISLILKARFDVINVGDVFEVSYKGYNGSTTDTYTMKLEVQLDE